MTRPGRQPRWPRTAAGLEHHTAGARETSLCVASGKAENAPEEASWAAQHPERGDQGAEGGRRDGGDACNRGRDGGGGEETSGDGSGKGSPSAYFTRCYGPIWAVGPLLYGLLDSL